MGRFAPRFACAGDRGLNGKRGFTAGEGQTTRTPPFAILGKFLVHWEENQGD